MRRFALVPLYLTCLGASADDGACKTHDFRGVYAFYSQGTNVTNGTPIAFAGSLTADGAGVITAWKDLAAVPANPPVPPNFKLVTPFLDRYEQAKSLGQQITYTVEPDCRITITGMFVGPTGAPSPHLSAGALVGRGSEALLVNASAQSPYLTVITMKRAAQSDGGEK